MFSTKEEQHFFSQNRAFRYGDGIFETIIFENTVLKNWNLHINRLKKSIEVLKFDAIDIKKVGNQLIAKIPDQSLSYRIRLQIWRAEGGLYTPKTNQTDIFIDIFPFEKSSNMQLLKTDFATSVYLNFSVFSSLKTCNALPYILASIEKKRTQLRRNHYAIISRIFSRMFELKFILDAE